MAPVVQARSSRTGEPCRALHRMRGAAQRSAERPVLGYRAVMFCAWRPVGICPTSKDTFWFSSRERFPWPTVVRSRTVLE